MTTHINHKSQKSMATGSAWGRLLTIAFLCIFICLSSPQKVFAAADIYLTIDGAAGGGNDVIIENSGGSVLEGPCNNFCPYLSVSEPIVQFRANAGQPGWKFSHWSGHPAIEGSNNPLSPEVFLLDGDSINVTAHFVMIDYTLTVNSTGGTGGATGRVTVSPSGPYHYGDVVTLTAMPQAGETFASWSANVVSTGATTGEVAMTSDQVVTATFAFIDYTLTVNSAGGTGGATGRVTVSPSGPYHYGDVVTLTAMPQAGETFASWSANVVSTGATTGEVTMTSDQVVTATFAFIDYTLTVNSTGGTGGATGRVTVSPSGPYHYGDVVTLTAMPQAGETFASWSANVVSTGATTGEVTMTSDQVVTAAFAFIDYTLTVNSAGGTGGATGRVTVSPSGPYHYGDVVTLTAMPQAGETFASWSANVVSTGATTGEVTMTSDQVVTATFAFIDYTLTVNSAGGTGGATGRVTVSPSGPYHYGDVVTLTAMPQAGETFASWSANVVSTGATTGEVTMTSDQVVTATFAFIDYTLTVNSTGGTGGATGRVTVSPSGPYHYGDVVTLTAMPQAGETFASWSANVVSTGATTGEVAMTSDQVVTAAFAFIDYTLTVNSAGGTGGATGRVTVSPSGPYHYGDVVTLTAMPQAGETFASWSANVVSTGATTGEVTMTSDQVVTATFAFIDYTLTVNSAGGTGGATGRVTVSPSGPYHYGDVVTLTAMPQAGETFASWSANVVSTGATTGEVTMTSDQVVTAAFAFIDYTLDDSISEPAGLSGAAVSKNPTKTTYHYGDTVELTALPGAGENFTGWTGDVTSGSNPVMVTIDGNKSVTANFGYVEYNLTVDKIGGFGTGLLSIIPNQATYHLGNVVTISASPGVGEQFINWTGDGVDIGGSPPDRQVTFDGSGSKTVTANFDFIEYTLTVTSAGGTGGATDRVMVSPPGTYHYDDVVALTANPQVGETFANWSGDLAGSNNPETITINGDKTVTANFEKIPVTLTMQVDILDAGAFGTVTPDPAGNPHAYLWGDTVAVSATPNPNTVLANWSSNVVGGVVTMNGDQTVTAKFELKGFKVKFYAAAAGLNGKVQDSSGIPTNFIEQTVKWGQNSTVVSAVADEHYHFLNWTNAAGDIVSTVEGLQATGVTQDMEFTANFEIDKFSVTFISSNYGGIEVEGTPPEYYEDEYTEIVDWGTDTKLVTARLDDFSQFQGWHGDYTSADLTIQVTNVQQDMTVTYDTVPDINGCSTDVAAGYSSGFQATDFKRVNVDVDTVTGHMVLNTGNQAIDPNNIIIPFTQDVYVTFLYEGAGFQNSDFGYKFASEGKAGTKHQVYANINDNDNDGVLDGVGDRNLDGTVDRQDNKVFLGTIEGGTELVFYLDSTDNGCGDWCGDIFYTKRDWNDHDAHARCTTGIGRLVKLYEDGVEGDPTCYGYVAACGTGVHEQGWLNSVARTRLNGDFGFNFRAPEVGDPAGFNTKCIDELNATASTHAIVGAPDETPFAWVIGFDDTTMDNASKSNDYDYNDVVFLVERKTGGMAQLELANAIVPNEANAYFTAVTFDVWDFHPAGDCTGKTHTTYYVSAEGGASGSWIEITDWDKINVSDSSKTIGAEIDPAAWTPGTPEYTYRSRRIDLAGLGRTGNQLLWKAELVSEDEDCAPRIVDVQLKADTASHGFFARSSPVVQTNVIYAGTYETPSAAFPADERLNRGHLTANLLYVPEDPSQTLVDNTATAAIDETLAWDAGEVLKARNPDTRVIKFPDVSVTAEPDAILTDGAGDPIEGDGVTRTFSGTFLHYPVVATTVRIHDSDNDESFTDEFTDDLKGSLTGTGTINRFTGEWTVTFTNAPGAGKQIMASYSHYTASSLLKEFNNANVTTDILALNNQMVNTRYIHDFNGDNNFGESDADWLVQWTRGYKQPNTSTQKAWKLGPIDHSTPALLVPPGFPLWYFGSQVTKAERNKYKEFQDAYDERDSVLFVGSRDGMLHAFDAGKYRYGDNPETAGIEENRGYFLWEPKPSPAPDYCTSYAGNCPNYGTGEELWAFIPANLLPRLKNNLLKADDQSFVDASPALSDVYIDYSPKDGQADTWRTVLLSAEGNGGDTVFCLDVTDPLNPTFMWEFAAPELFRSRSSPAVAQIGRIRDPNGTDAVKWVAFFVTGKVENSTLFPSIYMIDIADGSVLRKVVLDDPFDIDGSGTIEGAEIDYGRGGVPSGQPAIVDSDENGYIDRLYVATDKGLMYKVNIPDDPKNPAPWDISHCVLNIDFTDDDNNTIQSDQRLHPIYASPAIVVDNEITTGGDIAYKVMVFFGTGDNPYYDENINTATTRYHFFAYVDTNEKGESDPAKHNLDWFIELPAGNRIFASAFAAAGQIYFGTSTAETEDPCEGHLTPEGNEGRIYAVTLEGVVLLNKVVGDIRTSPLVEDEHLYFRTPTGLQSLGSGIYNNEVQAAGEPTINIRAWREIIN